MVVELVFPADEDALLRLVVEVFDRADVKVGSTGVSVVDDSSALDVELASGSQVDREELRLLEELGTGVVELDSGSLEQRSGDRGS